MSEVWIESEALVVDSEDVDNDFMIVVCSYQASEETFKKHSDEEIVKIRNINDKKNDCKVRNRKGIKAVRLFLKIG